MRIISFFIFIAVARCGCTANTMPSPYTLQEVLDLHSLLPIYKLGPEINNDLSQENTKYFLFDDGPEKRLIIYFMMTNSKSEIVRAAKLSIYTANGQLITLEENGNKSYPVKWAQGGLVNNCNVLPIGIGKDFIEGDEYQTCLFWFDDQLRQYKLYSTWPEEETAKFVDSLVLVKQ